jgi:hypothetical protein
MGEGERVESARRRRSLVITLVSLVVAIAIVVGTALFGKADHGVAPAWAIVFSLLYVGVLLFSAWRGRRTVDEVEARAGIRAMAVGTAVFGLVFPPWLFLGGAGLLPPADGTIMMMIVFVSVMIAYLWQRFR